MIKKPEFFCIDADSEKLKVDLKILAWTCSKIEIVTPVLGH